ncbi:hypothetical protein SCHIN_v1c06700 [Spiroplasma chinense]|uniref:Uncharacterized protein n=1 Tax=Spiroplasma chinense TaxID=216932 RepID=A0A5B9Y6H4_9MOLU|nr:hypothetical protein [Spiroplasma chinense]QEH61867.1 hypothetical protein SCHIN_v1c06700 [Spiroplasma chinense]
MFEKYNDMSTDQIKEELTRIEEQIEILKKSEKEIEKAARKNLFWWFFLPLFGFFVFNSLVSRRKRDTELGVRLSEVKGAMITLELEQKYVETKILNK